MTSAELEFAIRAAFAECDRAGVPLDEQQKQILLQMIVAQREGGIQSDEDGVNPLDQLTFEQRQVLLQFVREQSQADVSWKAQLLNDWLNGRASGKLQFVREQYGIQWLEQVKPSHIAFYLNEGELTLQVGDRIEVSNNLWEWVQDNGPCSREWFPCTVVDLVEVNDSESSLPQSYRQYTNCTIRFESGMEYEIQGVYEWNRYNWRWAKS